VKDGVVIALTRLNRILEVDIPNERVVVEPGVMNLDVTRAVAPHGFYYAPDPSSQVICSIGGNVAENSGGAHCLKYGFTVHHVLGVEAILPDGELVHLGGAALDAPGLDLLGVLVGSEGTLAVVTKVTLRILRAPERVRTLLAAFNSTGEAGAAVSAIIAAGIIPAAVEMMDRLTIEAAEAAVHPGFPNAEAVLIVELDGAAAEVDARFPEVEAVCLGAGATEVQVAADATARARFWKGRKAAFAAMGRVSPSYYVQDGVIPRTKLPEVLDRIRALASRSGLRIGNVFHAGDGNLHPLVCYDEAIEGQGELAERVAAEILTYCLEAGGSITGEHGVGADKAYQMPKMFTEDDLDTMQLVRCAFNPLNLANPGKVFPTPRLCGEVPGPYRAHPAERAGLAERF
jgi:glycolate oxidase